MSHLVTLRAHDIIITDSSNIGNKLFERCFHYKRPPSQFLSLSLSLSLFLSLSLSLFVLLFIFTNNEELIGIKTLSLRYVLRDR